MQGDGPFPDGINVTIRRNYIYEDAYDKLSPENGTSAVGGLGRGGKVFKVVDFWNFGGSVAALKARRLRGEA